MCISWLHLLHYNSPTGFPCKCLRSTLYNVCFAIIIFDKFFMCMYVCIYYEYSPFLFCVPLQWPLTLCSPYDSSAKINIFYQYLVQCWFFLFKYLVFLVWLFQFFELHEFSSTYCRINVVLVLSLFQTKRSF